MNGIVTFTNLLSTRLVVFASLKVLSIVAHVKLIISSLKSVHGNSVAVVGNVIV